MENGNTSCWDEISGKYSYFIFDCDGVVWRGLDYISTAVTAINKLIKMGKKLFFLSNTNTLTRQDLYDKLIKAGVDGQHITYENVYTSSYLTAKHIELNYPDIKKVYLVGMEGLRKELLNAGLTVSGSSEDDYKAFDYHEPSKYEIDDTLQAVVCGFDYTMNYYKMFYACQIINQTGKFFGTNYDHKIYVQGRYLPASYTLISSLEVATEQKAEIITKPDPRSLRIILQDHGINVGELDNFLMIGDNLGTDILFANNAGVASLLIFTGITTENDYTRMQGLGKLPAKPTYTLQHF
jgi:phosphoglycolate/pyridoxal phosphate phosphatase family enzyme